MARILSPTNDYWLSAFEGDLYDVYACSRFMEILYMSIQYHKIQHNGNLIMSFLQSPEVHTFIHSFILAIFIAPLQVFYYSEALPTTAQILYQSFTPKRTGNCR